MLTDREVLSTLNMLRSEHLDVRTVTMGINLFDCVSSDFDGFAYKVRAKISRYASKLVETCDLVGDRYGIPVVNKRISVSPIGTVGAAFACILVFALLRGVLRYAEQASNHYIAFKLLALIRDRVFGALRRLTPAKLEGRDRGDLISLITADIEQLEVFYAHTISPVCIAVVCVVGMTCFTARYHLLPALVLLAGYLLVGAALPVWSARRGDKPPAPTARPLPTPTAICWKTCAACGIRCNIRTPPTAPRALRPTARRWGKSRRR